MRVFVGIGIDADAKEKIQKALKPFYKVGGFIRWTETQNIHLTLKFLGEMEKDMCERVRKTLSEPSFSIPQFILKLRGLGKFPPGRAFSIFWIGAEPVQELLSLQGEIERRLSRLGFPRDSRPYSPHITLGRNKSNSNFKPLFSLLEEEKDSFIAETPVRSFQIYESRLTPQGPVYSILQEIHLE